MYVFTFCTPKYRPDAEVLYQTGKRHGVDVHVVEMWEEAESWGKATKLKPRVTLEVLHHVGGPCLWLDADSRILRPFPPLEPPLGAEVGMYKDPVYGYNSAVMWWSGSRRSIELCEEWLRNCDRPCYPDDQHAFFGVSVAAGEDFWCLPHEWSVIFDIDWLRKPTLDPIILQTQASRRLRGREP